jgi:hypothetical protein
LLTTCQGFLPGWGILQDEDRRILRVSNQQEVLIMPLTKKGKKIKNAMKEEYGAKKGEQVFYASQNKGTIKGTHKKSK